ncbi:MAG TPA: carbamoyltransferase N-terminal domain-containing protein, partial [Gemmatimonadaceae bacterium]
MNVLGVHIGHDSSAALVRDGRIVADVAEERFVRIKHYSKLPTQSIDYCLKSHGMTMNDIDVIAVPAAGVAPDLNFLFDLKGPRQEIPGRRAQAFSYIRKRLGRAYETPPLY